MLLRLGEVLLQVLAHGEALDLLNSKDRGHDLVGSEPLLVLRVLQVLLLQIGPEFLDTLRKRDLKLGRKIFARFRFLPEAVRSSLPSQSR